MTNFGFSTTGDEVVSAFADRVKGKAILITGPTPGGLGAETARALSRASPRLLLLAGRTESKITPLIEEINASAPAVTVHFVQIDLSSQKSVRSAVQLVKEILEQEKVPTLDLLINNAAIMMCPYAVSEDGIESQFATNHIGHFLFTNLLLKQGLITNNGKTDSVRIINVSSVGQDFTGFDITDVNFQNRPYHPAHAYSQAKAANVLFSRALADHGINSFSLNPGSISTNLQVHFDTIPGGRDGVVKDIIADYASRGKIFEMPKAKTMQEGCATTLVAALDPSIAAQNGAYLSDGQMAEERHTKDPELAGKLWKVSEDLVGEKFAL